METDVLVVGAGPVGLTAAAELRRRGVAVKIIDKNAHRSDKSKALAVHAGTLEALKASFGQGFVQKLMEAGYPVKKAFIHFYKLEPVYVDLSVIQSEFNFVLVLPQSETERFLEELLLEKQLGNIKVDRNTELVSLTQNSDGVTAVVRDADGREYPVTSKYVIGADGAHSVVREQVQIPFKGGSYSGNFLLGDVTLEWPWEYGTMRIFISDHGFMAGFPIDGKNYYRLVFVENNKSEDVGKNSGEEVTLAEFSALALKFAPKPVIVKSARWLSSFKVHHRMTTHFQRGRVFVAGDAAHIHSPAGGQGMNTGMQDAFNLGFKLAQVIQGKAPPSLLEKYEKERMPVARKVVQGTDLPTRLGLSGDNQFTQFLKSKIAPSLIGFAPLQKFVVRSLSQVKTARREIEERL